MKCLENMFYHGSIPYPTVHASSNAERSQLMPKFCEPVVDAVEMNLIDRAVFGVQELFTKDQQRLGDRQQQHP
jgi:hypothetical protein